MSKKKKNQKKERRRNTPYNGDEEMGVNLRNSNRGLQ